jgi:hypothetical protein
VNKSGNEQLSLRELKNSNLFKMLALLDEEEDINKVLVCADIVGFAHLFCACRSTTTSATSISVSDSDLACT